MLTVAGADPVVDGWKEKREVESAAVLCGGFRLAWAASRNPKVRLATSVDDHHKSPDLRTTTLYSTSTEIPEIPQF